MVSGVYHPDDGQIFLESDMFNAGIRPAMDAGIGALIPDR